jgi:outer membrane receptor for ferrienterochelin and colicins
LVYVFKNNLLSLNFKTRIWMKLVATVFVILCMGFISKAQTDSLAPYLNMSLEELLELNIVTASNKSEKLSEAPATTIVIGKKQIEERGYKDLLEVLQELPGIDMSVAFGDTYFKDYWRGYRNTIGSAFLFLIDGVVQNDLYYNHTASLAATPLSNIEQIEVVYGPASSVYGANAFMGVVNVVTAKEMNQETSVNGSLSGSVKSYMWADMSVFQKVKNTKISITARYESGDMNQMINNNDFYWLQDKFLTDKRLWGDFVNNSKFGGVFSSPIKNTGVDFRVSNGGFEFVVQYFENYTGCGSVFPADRSTPQGLWVLPMYDVYGKFRHRFSDKLLSTTMMRYRKTDLTNESQDVEGFNIRNDGLSDMTIGGGTLIAPGESIRVVLLNYWQSLNSSRSFTQDFEWNINEKFTVNTGLKFEDKDLQKAYDINSGILYYPDSLRSVTDALPSYQDVALQSYNRVNWIDKGVYIQGKYRIAKNSIFNFGYRFDENSTYGITPTVRLGVVQKIGKFNLKLLYGQAYQEPTPRNLYGGWKGSGADPDLNPENSQTAEFNISYARKSSTGQLSFWLVNNTNTIVNTSVGAKNLGERNVAGMDCLMQMDVPLFKKTNIQLYYSLILRDEEIKFDSEGIKVGVGNIGDLSQHKVHFGITSYIRKNLFINFKGQYRGNTKLVSTNPLNKLNDYFVLDGNLTWKDFAFKGIGVSLKVVNIFNTKYYHPGLREANSGNSGGTWDGRAWNGSGGWYNSLLPQPRRCVVFSVNFQV